MSFSSTEQARWMPVAVARRHYPWGPFRAKNPKELALGWAHHGWTAAGSAISVVLLVGCNCSVRGIPRPRPTELYAPGHRPLDLPRPLQRADVLVLGGAEPSGAAGIHHPRPREAARQLENDPRRGHRAVRPGPDQGGGFLQRHGLQFLLPQRLEALLPQMVR